MIEPGQTIEGCTGVVKWWSRVRGYGHITSTRLPGLDIFVHYSDIDGEGHRNLLEDEAVSFDAVPNHKNGKYKGWKAVNVKKLRNYG